MSSVRAGKPTITPDGRVLSGGVFAAQKNEEPPSGALSTPKPPLDEQLAERLKGSRELGRSAKVVESTAAASYVRNLAEVIGTNHPGVQTVHFEEVTDPESGHYMRISHVSMADRMEKTPEELSWMNLRDLDEDEISAEALVEHLDVVENGSNEAYEGEYTLDIAEHMDAGNEDEDVVYAYIQKLDELVHGARDQLAAAMMNRAAHQFADKFPSVATFTLETRADGDYPEVTALRFHDGSVANHPAFGRRDPGVPEREVDWDEVGGCVPQTDETERLTGQELNVHAYLGWHPGDAIPR